MANLLRGVGGIWPATLTPFLPDGRLDVAALAAHITDIARVPGVEAVVVNGHAGEVSSLSRDERAAVIRCAVAAAEGVPVIAGIVADDAAQACILSSDAQRNGAQGLLLFPPALFAQGINARPEMAMAFVRAVAQTSRLPIVLFQLSQNLSYSTALLVQLCREIPEIVGVKEGSDIPQRYEDNLRALRALDRPIGILTTNNSWLMASLAYGGDGILSGLGSVAAELLVALHTAMATGQIEQARAVNKRLVPLCRAFYRTPYFDAHNRMKTALHLMGKLPRPEPREPLLPIQEAEREQIRAALIAAGLLADPDAPQHIDEVIEHA